MSHGTPILPTPNPYTGHPHFSHTLASIYWAPPFFSHPSHIFWAPPFFSHPSHICWQRSNIDTVVMWWVIRWSGNEKILSPLSEKGAHPECVLEQLTFQCLQFLSQRGRYFHCVFRGWSFTYQYLCWRDLVIKMRYVTSGVWERHLNVRPQELPHTSATMWVDKSCGRGWATPKSNLSCHLQTTLGYTLALSDLTTWVGGYFVRIRGCLLVIHTYFFEILSKSKFFRGMRFVAGHPHHTRQSIKHHAQGLSHCTLFIMMGL